VTPAAQKEGTLPQPGRLSRAGAHVTVEHVSKVYDGRLRVLQDISIELFPGELVGLTGPSGCGKSTLLNLIGALDRPTSGRIVVDDVSLSDLRRPARFRRETVGFVFQLHNLLPALSARMNVEVPMIAAGVSHAERRRRAQELLVDVGLGDRAEHLPGELSGGERQRVAIARALANRPRLLLADEPTGALDSRSSRIVLDLISRLRDEHGMTVLTVSYDPGLGAWADRVVGMLDGRLVGSTRDPWPSPDQAG
jgi:putative ABC transport system ATP-binding protein